MKNYFLLWLLMLSVTSSQGYVYGSLKKVTIEQDGYLILTRASMKELLAGADEIAIGVDAKFIEKDETSIQFWRALGGYCAASLLLKMCGVNPDINPYLDFSIKYVGSFIFNIASGDVGHHFLTFFAVMPLSCMGVEAILRGVFPRGPKFMHLQ